MGKKEIAIVAAVAENNVYFPKINPEKWEEFSREPLPDFLLLFI